MDEIFNECDDLFQSVQDILPRDGVSTYYNQNLSSSSSSSSPSSTPTSRQTSSTANNNDFGNGNGSMHGISTSTSPQQDSTKLTLLTEDQIIQHGLAPAIDKSKSSTPTRKRYGFEEEEEEEGGGGEEHTQEFKQNESVEDDDDIEEEDDTEGNKEKDFIRIPISEAEYWSIQEKVWEDKQNEEEQNLGDEDGEADDSDDDNKYFENSPLNSPLSGPSNSSSVSPNEGNDEQNEFARALRFNNEMAAYDSFELNIIFERRRTGFEETKELKVYRGMILAGRYEVLRVVGEAAFSTALCCLDLDKQIQVCIKVIKNNKDYFDQSLDEIKLLKYLNSSGNADEKHIIKMFDFFYHKEHLFIVTELLRDNLYTVLKACNKLKRERKIHIKNAKQQQQQNIDTEKEEEEEEEAIREELYDMLQGGNFFCLDNLRKLAKQCLQALIFVHGLGIIHCDIKPENILVENFENVNIKLIDFGSSCFTTDHLSSYIQSRFYRAPEVILGLKYDQRIDIWSLGCVLAELYTGKVLFESLTTQTLLVKVVGTLGGFPQNVLTKGKFASKYFIGETLHEKHEEEGGADLLYAKKSNLKAKLNNCPDELFVDFISSLLCLDPKQRPSADIAIHHPWIQQE